MIGYLMLITYLDKEKIICDRIDNLITNIMNDILEKDNDEIYKLLNCIFNIGAISTDYIANTSGTNTGDEPDADTSTKGIVALATLSQASTGTNSTRAVTPAGVKKFDDDRKYTEEITSAISANSGYDVDHGLGTRDVIVKVYALVTDLTTSGTDIVTQYDEVQIDVNHATTAKVVITPNIGIRAVATGSLKVLVKAL